MRDDGSIYGSINYPARDLTGKSRDALGRKTRCLIAHDTSFSLRDPMLFFIFTFSTQGSTPRTNLQELPMPGTVQRAEEKLDLDTDTLWSHTDSIVQFKHPRGSHVDAFCFVRAHQSPDVQWSLAGSGV